MSTPVIVYGPPSCKPTTKLATQLQRHYGAARVLTYGHGTEERVQPGDLVLTQFSRTALESQIRAGQLPRDIRIVPYHFARQCLRAGRY